MQEPVRNGPHCVGIIMDGNRRFARAHGLSVLEGHQAGLEKVKEISKWAQEAGIGTLIVYAFSTENWNRAQEEVAHLMQIFSSALDKELEDIRARGVRIRFFGDLSRLPGGLEKRAQRLEEETKDAVNATLAIALSYGGRAEVLSAVNRLLAQDTQSVDEEAFSQALWTNDLPDPDLIIRTGGEKRLSNFLPWQSVYSELHFTNTYWPAFSHEEFTSILKEFATRERRHGK